LGKLAGITLSLVSQALRTQRMAKIKANLANRNTKVSGKKMAKKVIKKANKKASRRKSG